MGEHFHFRKSFFVELICVTPLPANLYSMLITAQSASGMGGFKWMLQRYIMEMSHLKSRRVKLTTGNTRSMQMCILLLFEQVSNTPKSPRYWPKCAVKNQGSPLFNVYLNRCIVYNDCWFLCDNQERSINQQVFTQTHIFFFNKFALGDKLYSNCYW